MKRIGLLFGWCFCLYATAALLQPKLVAIYPVSPSDSIPDRLVSWCAVLVIWWVWVRCMKNIEGLPDDFSSLPGTLLIIAITAVFLWLAELSHQWVLK